MEIIKIKREINEIRKQTKIKSNEKADPLKKLVKLLNL